MGGGYVLDFSDRTIQDFVLEVAGLEIHSDKYTNEGTSKAKKVRAFWSLESDAVVGTLLGALVGYAEALGLPRSDVTGEDIVKCREIASRLLAGGPALGDLRDLATRLDAKHLAEQIRRMEAAVESDPGLAIGTAKELIETTCKTILRERGVELPGNPDVGELTKRTFKELDLVAKEVPNSAQGATTVKLILNNLAVVGVNIAALRNLYGTGHGKDGKAGGLTARHAKLAVGTSATLCRFLFETHLETKPSDGKDRDVGVGV
jgi:hypothetical protein